MDSREIISIWEKTEHTLDTVKISYHHSNIDDVVFELFAFTFADASTRTNSQKLLINALL